MKQLLYIVTKLFQPIILLYYKDIWGLKKAIQAQKYDKYKAYLLQTYDSSLRKNGSWIGYNATFAGIPCFPHGISGVYISGGAKIGRNCIIFHQVTIGSNTLIDSHKQGSPTVGNNVYIGAGAKIIGNVQIGDNCRIGANAVVYHDMKPYSVAVQQPTRIISKRTLDNRYYSQRNGTWVYYNDGKWVEDENPLDVNK